MLTLINIVVQKLYYHRKSQAWESIRDNIKTSVKENLGYHRLKHNKPWHHDDCSKLIDQWKQAKLQWLQNPSQINGDNLQNLRCVISRTFKDKVVPGLN
jgi:hypothetical protein